MDNIIKQILQITYTKQQLQHRLNIFNEVLNLWLFTDNGQAELAGVIEKYSADNPHLKAEDADLIKVVMTEIEKQMQTADMAKQAHTLLTELEQGLLKCRVISLYLAFAYDDQVMAELGKWCKENLAYDFIWEPSFDGSLIGGCAISYQGIYRDASLRAKIDQNREIILNSLLQYKR